MKKIIINLFLLVGIVMLSACTENENPIFDTTNGRAIAGFSNPTDTPNIIYNPAANTENVITVGVSTLSDSDRTVVLSLDAENTSLDASFYSISSLSPVIPAGEFTVDVIITTLGSPSLPASDDVIALKLESVQGAEILDDSRSDLKIGVSVQCPTVDLASIPGTYLILVDDFETSVGDNEFQIVAGPGANQVTFVNPFDHTNPDTGGSYSFIVDIDPDSGAASVERQAAWHCDNFGCGFGEGRVDGLGIALTCIGQIQLTLKNTVDAGSFGSYALVVEKQ